MGALHYMGGFLKKMTGCNNLGHRVVVVGASFYLLGG